MGPPLKRRRLFESASSDLDLAERRARNDLKLKSRFESIFEKYGRDFSGVGDEIDFEKEEIVVNNGHIKGMVNEGDVGGNKGASNQRHKDQSSSINNTTCDGPSIASGWETSEEDPLCSLKTTITSSAHHRRNDCSKLAQSETVELNGKGNSRPEKSLSPGIIKAPGESVVVQSQRAEYPMEAAWHFPLLPVDKILLNRSHTLSSSDDSDLYSDSESDQSLSPFGRSLWAVNTSDRWTKWPKWTKEEDDLIRDLKASGSLKAADVYYRFPGRTLGALKYRWSTLLRGTLRKTDNAMSSSIPKSSPIVTKERCVIPRQCQSESKLDLTSHSMHRRSEHPETNDSDDEDILASSGSSLLVSHKGDLKWTSRPKTPSSQEMGNPESQGSQHTVEQGRNINSEELTREQPEASGTLRRPITIDSTLLPSIAADPEKANQHHPAKETGALGYSQPLEVKYSQKSRTSSIPEDTRRLEKNAKEAAELSYLTPDSQGSELEHDPPRAVRKRGKPLQHPSNCSDPNQAVVSHIDSTSSSLTRSVTAVAAGSGEGKKQKPDVMDFEGSNRHMQDQNSCKNVQSGKHQADQQPTPGVHRMGLRPRKPRNKPSTPGSLANAHGKSVDFIPKAQRRSQVTAGSKPATTSVDKVVIDLTGCDDMPSCSDHENQAVNEGFQNSVAGGGGKSTEISKYLPNNHETHRVIVLIPKLSSPHNPSEDQSTLDAIDMAALEKAELPNILPERRSPSAECSEIPAVEADDNRDHFHLPTQKFRASNAFERRQLHTTGSPFSLPFTPENGDLSDDELSTPVKAIRQPTEMTPVPARSWRRKTFCLCL